MGEGCLAVIHDVFEDGDGGGFLVALGGGGAALQTTPPRLDACERKVDGAGEIDVCGAGGVIVSKQLKR